jgi:hypothetical protein
MNTMKPLPIVSLCTVLALSMVACSDPAPPPVVVPTTADLILSVAGPEVAPVKLLNARGAVSYDGVVTGSRVFSDLPRGKYTLSGGAVKNFAVPATQTIDLSAGDASATLSYTALTTADLTLTVTGVALAPVKLLDEAGAVKFDGPVTGSKTFSALPRGKYRVTAAAIVNFAAPATQMLDLSDGDATVALAYTALTTADLTLSVSGVPAAPIKVASDAGVVAFEGTVSGSRVVPALPRGRYTVTAGAVSDFVPPTVQVIDLSAGNSALTLPYTPVPLPSLAVTVAGVPSAPVRVVSAAGPVAAGTVAFDGMVSGSKTLSALPRGQYTVTGGAVQGFVTPAAQMADLSRNDGQVTLTYTPVPTAPLTLVVSGVGSAPVKVTQGAAVLFDGPVMGTLTLPRLLLAPTTVTAGAVTGYVTPATLLIDLLQGPATADLKYVAAADAARVRGQIASWTFGAAGGNYSRPINVLSDTILTTFQIDSTGAYDAALPTPVESLALPFALTPVLPFPQGCQDSVMSSNAQAKMVVYDGTFFVVGTGVYAHPLGLGLAGNVDPVQGSRELYGRWYSTQATTITGSQVCGGASPPRTSTYNVSLQAGWNIVRMVLVQSAGMDITTYTDAPAGPVGPTQFLTPTQIGGSAPTLELRAGSVSVAPGGQADIQANAWFVGAVPFSPDLLSFNLTDAPVGLSLITAQVPFAPHEAAFGLTVTADAALAPGTYTVTLVASGSGYTATALVEITVTP